MASQPLEPGDPLRLGRFELVARLGQGGQGVVYLGRGTGPGEERVAIKVLRSSVDGMELQRLGRELDAIHQVQPFVTARVIEASAEDGRRFVVSEFIDGPSLQERVRARGPLPEGELQRLAVGTATALTAIHGAGVVHRDFKPANVLLGPDGPRVVDFGIARLIDAGTVSSGIVGTLSFMAPEQLAGERPGSPVDAALVIAGVLLLARPPAPSRAADTGSGSGAGHTSGPSPTTTPVAGPTIPQAFAGSWTGTATLASLIDPGVSIKNPITFTFVAGTRTAHEVNQDCVNALTLSRVTGTVLTFSEPQTASCQAGTVTFSRHGARLAYHWADINNLAQNSAVLRMIK